MVPPHAVHTPALARDARRRISAAAWQIGLLVREGESGVQYWLLTRSIHLSCVVKSGVEIVGSQARGGLQSALITTQKRTPGTRRFLCGFEAHSSPAKRGIPCNSVLPYPHRVPSRKYLNFAKKNV